MTIEILLIVALILANGAFAMAEMAVVSSRKPRLKQAADQGDRKSKVALALAEHPNDFLSTVQVGITLIGTLAGAFGGATLAERVTPMLAGIPAIAPYASTISITVVVICITYLSLVLGELVPKRIALGRPERIAAAVAPFMKGLSKAAHPIARVLSFSTELVLAVIPLKKSAEPPITEEEIKVLIEQGTAAGAFEEAEQEMVTGVFRLADRRAAELMTPRHQVIWLDRNAGPEDIRRLLIEDPHSTVPVADGSLDRIIGVLHVRNLIAHWNTASEFALSAILQKPLFLPEATSALHALELFQKSGTHFGVVLDEHGGVEGVLTITDVLEAVVGDLPDAGHASTPLYIRREDGSLLVQGEMTVSELREVAPIGHLPGENKGTFTTVGGFIMMTLERVPQAGDSVEAGGWHFEVADMGGHRVGSVIVSGAGDGGPAPSTP